jgi:hypothetical protein
MKPKPKTVRVGSGWDITVSVRVGFLNFETGLCGSVRIVLKIIIANKYWFSKSIQMQSKIMTYETVI